MSQETPPPPPATTSPADDFPVRPPTMKFLYRLECEMAEEKHVVAPAAGKPNARIIMPIVGGKVKGPRIEAEILHMSGADWAVAVGQSGITHLNARYTLLTTSNHKIYIRSKGVFKTHPGVSVDFAVQKDIGHEQVDWFTRLQFEADGEFEWLNGVFGLGVLEMREGRLFIDAFEVTNLV